MPGVVPFQTTGFPEGAGSAKEAVMKQIASENQAQQNMNQSFGGASKRSKRSSKRHSMSAKHKRSSSKRMSAKRSSHKRSSAKHKRSSYKHKQSRKKRTYKKVIYRGGEGELEAGKEVSVPQFGSSNNSGPMNPNALSAKLNEVSLAQEQGAIHDDKINDV